MWSSCSFHIARNVSHGTENLFLEHEPLSEIHEYQLKKGKRSKEWKRIGLDCPNCVSIVAFTLSALWQWILFSFFQLPPFPEVFSSLDNTDSES